MTNAAASQPPSGHDLKIPGGSETLAQAKLEKLNYWENRIGKALREGASKYPARDKAMHAALVAELARRNAGGNQGTAPAAASAGSALAIRKADELAGAYRDPSDITRMLRAAAEVAHLITPQTSCGELPVGCCIASSAVLINVPRETYPTSKSGPDLGLDRNALNRIASAAGVDWDPVLSCRLDNGRNPYYVHWRSVAYVQDFDGRLLTKVGNVELDLRDGAEEAELCTPNQLPIKRKFILRLAESLAKNRAIRDLGVRASYKPHELEIPFVVVKLMFTGQTDDPRLREMFAGKIADKFLGARNQLYPSTRPPLALVPPMSTTQHDPPPVGESAAGDDDWTGYGDPAQLSAGAPANAIDLPAQRQTELTLQQGRGSAVAKPTAQTKTAPPPSLPARAGHDAILIAECDTEALERWETRIHDDIQDSIYPREEVPGWEETLQHVRAELKKRKAQAEKY